jgi:EAL domain-containing protein (putative c-di-GMP-specific phosphodiesterase class I)/CheY-like chemotaxis protein
MEPFETLVSADDDRPRVLLVDDDPTVRQACARMLAAHGYVVETAGDGEAATEAIGRASFDVILTDIVMPGMNGIRLLDRVRERDLDVPVILLTGAPSLETAILAIERGALRYLIKPLEPGELVRVTDDAVRLHRIAKAKRQALELAGGVDRLVGDRAGLVAAFGRALDSRYMAYQPIVSSTTKRVFAYEALLRSREPSLPHPEAVIDAAERLGRVHDLGRAIRTKAVEPIGMLAEGVDLFLNLHARDLLDEQLFRTDTPLAAVAHRVVLAITERASLHDVRDVAARVASLRELGFRLAIDDLGAGYAGLTSFALLEPEIAKLDMVLVRDVHKDPTKQTLVRTMVSMCKQLGILVIAEGIETQDEREELERAGCDLMQGHLFAKAGAPFLDPFA